MVGLDGQCAVVARERFFVALEIEQGIAAVVERIGVAGCERQRPVITGERLVVVLELALDETQIEMDAGLIGLDRQRALEAGSAGRYRGWLCSAAS